MTIYGFKFIVATFVLSIFNSSAATNITLISMSFLPDEAVSNAYHEYSLFRQDSPAYDVVIRRLQQADPEIFENFTHISLHCLATDELLTVPTEGPAAYDRIENNTIYLADSEIASCFFKFYYEYQQFFLGKLEDQFTIITTTSVKERIASELASFSPETNSLLALSVPDGTLSDITRHPTSLNFFGMVFEDFVYVLGTMARKFSWNGVNVVCGGTSTNLFILIQCDPYRFSTAWGNSGALNLPWAKHDLIESLVQAGGYNESSSFNSVLSDISSRRTSLLLLKPDLLRNFMIAAYDRNMTNGDFVFVAFLGHARTGPDKGIFWQANDADDQVGREETFGTLQVAFVAFRSLLIIPDVSQQWNGSEEFRQEIADDYKKRFDWSPSPEAQNLIGPVRTLEWLSSIAECFTRALPDLHQMDMAQFVKSCVNRTYHLQTRSIYLNPKGALIAPVIVTRLDEEGHFSAFLSGFIHNRTMDYIGTPSWFGLDRLPGEIGPCGLHNTNCLSNTSTILVCIAGAFLSSAIFSILSTFIRKTVLQGRLAHLLIEQTAVSYVHQKLTEPDAVEASIKHEQSLGNRTPNNRWEKQPESRAEARNSGSKNSTGKCDAESDLVLGVPASYRDMEVYVKVLTTKQSVKMLTADLDFPNSVVKAAELRHQYLAEFIAISINESSCLSVIYERPAKGALADVLNQNVFFTDIDLRLTLMANLIEAVDFIHSTDLKYHGALSSAVCLINNRYTIRIALAGFRHLTAKLVTNKTRSCFKTRFRQRKEVTTVDHQRGDIRSLGLIIVAMFQGDASASAGACVKALTAQKSSSPIIEAVEKMMAACLDKPAKRPTARELTRWTKSMGLGGQTVVELLLERLQSHAENLQEEVDVRTRDLLHEMKKVDDLLLEMLPRAIIGKLRNHEAITPELYDSATVLFSDMPVFSRLTEECAPLDVVSFLSQVHSCFDVVVAEFREVYKVETINDSYVVVSGIPVRNGTKHASEICRLALRLRVAASSVSLSSWGDLTACPRIGINSGHAAAGVVGTRMPRFCLFGDTMNTASRMESHGSANRIHVSDVTKDLSLQTADPLDFVFVSRGLTTIKGKGQLQTYWLKCGKSRQN